MVKHLVLRILVGQDTVSTSLLCVAWPTSLLTGHVSERENLREVIVWEDPAGCLGRWWQESRGPFCPFWYSGLSLPVKYIKPELVKGNKNKSNKTKPPQTI